MPGCELKFRVNMKDGASVDPEFITVDPSTGVLSFETQDPKFYDATLNIVLRA